MIRPSEGGIRLDADQRILVRALARFPKVMGVFSRGFGKCVASDTLIFTDTGMKEIGRFFEYQDDDKETYFKHDIGIVNRYGEIENSDKGVYSGKKPTRVLATEDGYEIEGTLIHPLLVMDSKGDLEWRKLKDIKVGDYLPINTHNDIWGENDISDKEIEVIVNNLEDKIPRIILEGTRDTVGRFLDKLIAIRGTTTREYTKYRTTSAKISKQIQVMLLNFGIVSTRNRVLDNRDNIFYDICIFDINFDFNGNQYYYSKVSDIKESENHVYDIQVPESNSFIANGFVSHNTFLQLLVNYHKAILYPGIELAMTAQTKENAASLVSEKWREISRFFPLMANEVKGTPNISKDKAEIGFKSKSFLDTLANAQSSKGARRHGLTVEESAQTSKELFEDVLEPVVNIPRKTIGRRAIVNPYELNGSISRFTTSWYRGIVTTCPL